MEVIILAGGLGTRLRSVCPDLPKPMVDVHGKPFLEYLLRFWKAQGASRFILAIGYLHEKISLYFGKEFEGIPIVYAIEEQPLGTGGGLLNALKFAEETSVFVANGDTYFPLQPQEMLAFHQGACSFALFQIEENTRYGGVKMLTCGQITSLDAKDSLSINGGCYLMNVEVISEKGKQFSGAFSLEKDLFPRLIAEGLCYGRVITSSFIDIGIPEDYSRFISQVAAPV